METESHSSKNLQAINVSRQNEVKEITINLSFSIMLKDLFKQSGRVAVITGGNRGIGADVVEKLLQCEINVVMGKQHTNKME